MDLFRGINASDRENYEAAAQHYESALKKDPGICISRDALVELDVLGLIPSGKRSRKMLQRINARTSLTDELGREEPEKRHLDPKDVTTPVDIDLRFPQ